MTGQSEIRFTQYFILPQPRLPGRLPVGGLLGCGCGAVLAGIVLLLAAWLAPKRIPFGIVEFWGLSGTPLDIADDAWPMFAVGGLVLIVGLPLLSDQDRDLAREECEEGLGSRLWSAIVEAFVEALTHRWLGFYAMIPIMAGLGFVLFGFLDLHLTEWVFRNALIPVADVATQNKMHDLLRGGYDWTVGGAVVAMVLYRGVFYGPIVTIQPGSEPEGLMRRAWSLVGSLYLFMIMFRYGLVTAILVHVAYNLMALAITEVWYRLLR